MLFGKQQRNTATTLSRRRLHRVHLCFLGVNWLLQTLLNPVPSDASCIPFFVLEAKSRHRLWPLPSFAWGALPGSAKAVISLCLRILKSYTRYCFRFLSINQLNDLSTNTTDWLNNTAHMQTTLRWCWNSTECFCDNSRSNRLIDRFQFPSEIDTDRGHNCFSFSISTHWYLEIYINRRLISITIDCYRLPGFNYAWTTWLERTC